MWLTARSSLCVRSVSHSLVWLVVPCLLLLPQQIHSRRARSNAQQVFRRRKWIDAFLSLERIPLRLQLASARAALRILIVFGSLAIGTSHDDTDRSIVLIQSPVLESIRRAAGRARMRIYNYKLKRTRRA